MRPCTLAGLLNGLPYKRGYANAEIQYNTINIATLDQVDLMQQGRRRCP